MFSFAASPPSTPAKRAPSSRDDLETDRGRGGEDAPVTPTKGAPVRVDAAVKGVYRYIDKKTYLDWGLTSDWSVEGPRKRRSIGGDDDDAAKREREEADGDDARRAKKAKTATEEGEDENAASEGY